MGGICPGHLLPPHTAASLMTPPNPYSNTSSLPHWKISSHTLAAAAAAVAATLSQMLTRYCLNALMQLSSTLIGGSDNTSRFKLLWSDDSLKVLSQNLKMYRDKKRGLILHGIVS